MAAQENNPHETSLGPDDANPPTSEATKSSDAPAVRFASENEEIEPPTIESLTIDPQTHETTAERQEQFQQLTTALGQPRLQERRMSHFAFEPVSLPASRVASNEEASREASRHNTRNSSGRPSPHQSPGPGSMHSPPITPAATRSRDAMEGATAVKGAPLHKVEDRAAVTPQISPPGTSGASPTTSNVDDSRPASSGQTICQPRSQSESAGAQTGAHRGSAFSIGPTNTSSVPTSREQSPTRTTTGSTYSRPFTPAGDANDPYAAHKRPPQTKNLDTIDQRFKFTALGSKARQSANPSSTSLPRSNRGSDNPNGSDKRHPRFSGKDHLSGVHDESSTTIHQKHGGSMSDLKRFLKIGGHHKVKRTASPTASVTSGTKTPPHHKSAVNQIPFDDNHGLTSRYGKFGKVLGAGAGGSVRLMKRSSDNTLFAVKEFRARHSYESEKEYGKKVTAEFCVGSTLHHGNIIESLDIVREKEKWYEVMEYAPFDLFAIVMTGKMSREEVSCSFLQILSGVTYMHSMGLAHRDLKLDNVVVNEHGIMKIIDFGSASVFRYPFESVLVLATGIVGSDPYLAPEVYDERKYDPRPADIWSLAIIFCCMSLRRFPWKMPRITDNSYKLFASPPTPGTDMKRLSDTPVPSKSTTDLDTPARDAVPDAPASTPKVDAVTKENGFNSAPAEKKPEVIKGPWRLLRLLPRESRHIISRMLEIDPKKRATMDEILLDPWVANTQICQQDPEGKAVIRAPGHAHTLEPPAAPPSQPGGK